jgi:hypothetical protein
MDELKNIHPFEILLIDEYADRLKVGRSTIWNWKNDGTLIPGHHYLQKGKVLRFIWARDLILELHDDNGTVPDSDEQILPEVTPTPKPRSKKVGINLDY